MASSGQIAAPVLQELLEAGALVGQWTLDPSRSTVSLRSRTLGLVPVNGVFRQVTGQGTVSPRGEVSGAITVVAASIDTKNTRRDTHLRSADFFDSENYPDITFTVQGIRPSGRGVAVTGTLGVRDHARLLSFDSTAAVHGDGEAWLDAEVHINRADLGLTWNLMGLVSMNNTITIHAVFTRQ
jgi:polyisoprenoid-binding protein YceI